MQKKLFIQINESCLLIAQIKSNSKLQKIKTYKLDNNEIYKNKLFNLSQIHAYIKNYLKENKIKKATAIISSSLFEQIPKPKQNLLALQHILTFGKANLEIQKIITNREGNNTMDFFKNHKKDDKQLDFFKKFKPPQKTSNYWWLLTTIACLSLIIISTIILRKNKIKKVNLLNLQLAPLLEKNKKLKLQVQKLYETQKLNESKKIKLEKINKLKEEQNNPKKLLKLISKNIPEKCWIKKLEILKQKITIEGKSFNTQDILQFSTNLTKSKLFKNLRTENIGKIKSKTNTKKNPIYSFKFSGNLI